MSRLRRALLAALTLAAAVPLAAPAEAQAVDVTFRFVPDLTTPAISPVVRAFVPGSFNDWGPNSNGRITTGAPSQATFEPVLGEYRYTTSLEAGQQYLYKIHVHENDAGTTFTWYTDPLGTETSGQFDDSVIRVADPFVFQVAREQEGTDQVVAVSAGVFGTEAITSVAVTVNETTYTDGIEDTGDGIYRLVLPEPVPPGSFVRVEATDAQSRAASGEVGVIPPAVTDAAVPEGLEDGITVDPNDPTRAWLVLRAPAKQYVYALGSFNGWAADETSLMFRDEDALGTRWWIELTGLTPDQEQTFHYWVDGLIRVADPYAPLVYYPGESRYPAGAQEHAVAAFTPGADPFPWTDGDWVPPAPEDLVVYELLVRDFVREHSFAALTDTLDYLDRLGINAIELMPVSEFDGDESWGYNPAFHLALDKYYGSPDDFKAFVDAAHARGIAVILDVVYNHATGQSPLIRLNNQGTFGPPTASNPWANTSARHPFNVFNDMNHESPLTQIWLDRANRYWMDEYHVDGYRYDLSKGFTQRQSNDVGAWNAYDASRVALLTRMADSLWAAHPDALIILEHLGDPREERDLAAYGREEGFPGMMLWNKMTDEYAESAMGYLGNRASLTRAYPPNNDYPIWGQIAYQESHDEQWQLYKLRTFGNQTDGYSTRQLATALDRKKLATVFHLTIPGPKMLWQFGEVGYGGGPGECLEPNDNCPSGNPGRVSNKPIRWDYWTDAPPFANGTGLSLTETGLEERDQRRKLYALTAAVLDLRQRYAVFGPDAGFEARIGGAVAGRWIVLTNSDAPAGEPTAAVVVGNFGLSERDVTPPFSSTGTWYGYFDDSELAVEAGETLTLRPGEYRIYTDVDVPSPAGNLGAVDAEEPVESPGERLAVYPNPSAGPATVELAVESPRTVRVELFDALGRRVAVLLDRQLGAGEHAVAVETSGLSAGVYVVRWEGQAVSLTVVR
ncbi:MAG: alpha-amylase family glycosyl hydrolase [Bacteroidota bacterium]